MKLADILIIGGGVMGASAAYHLASKGFRNILVIDQSKEPAQGSTGKATGGFRCQFATEVNVRLSLLSREKLLCFKEEHGIDAGYLPFGYLFLFKNEQERRVLLAANALQRQCGLSEAREIFVEDVKNIIPQLVLDEIIGGVYCPTDGFIRPLNILSGYIQSAQRLGVTFEFGTECKHIVISRNRIAEVHTSDDTITAETVINAAGAWAGKIAAMAGEQLAVSPLRRQVAVIQEQNILPEKTPMTIFVGDGFHFRVRDNRVLLLMPTDIPSSFNIHVDDDWIEKVSSLARKRVSVLSQGTIDLSACWAGLYEMTPDKHAILGRALEIENLYFINGSSGHGVMHSPALGQLLSEVILDGVSSSMNIHALRPSRFIEGLPNPTIEFL